MELGLRQTDPDLAVEDADRRGDGACLADAPLARQPDLDALRRREAVGDERRLERHDRLVGGQALPHLVAHVDQRHRGIAPICPTHRAPARSAIS